MELIAQSWLAATSAIEPKPAKVLFIMTSGKTPFAGDKGDINLSLKAIGDRTAWGHRAKS
jgi:hypothetical protein